MVICPGGTCGATLRESSKVSHHQREISAVDVVENKTIKVVIKRSISGRCPFAQWQSNPPFLRVKSPPLDQRIPLSENFTSEKYLKVETERTDSDQGSEEEAWLGEKKGVRIANLEEWKPASGVISSLPASWGLGGVSVGVSAGWIGSLRRYGDGDSMIGSF